MYSKLYNESWKYGKVKILKAALSGNDKKGQRSDCQLDFTDYFLFQICVKKWLFKAVKCD